jgi:hypothetical protein
MRMTKADVDESLYLTARTALDSLKVSALEFLESHPKASQLELAECLNRGTTAIGLTMAIYEEAARTGRTREIAIELLFRRITAEFPDGWCRDENVHAAVKLGGWDYDVARFANECNKWSMAVLRELTVLSEPPIGWKPQSAKDERLQLVFEKYWPGSRKK